MMKNILFLFLAFTIATFNASAQKTDSTKRVTFKGLQNKATEALIILDGKKQPTRGLSSIDGISPDNIESINIYKDSAGIALYGIDGKDGVIEIKTKGNASKYRGESYMTKGLDSNLKGKITGLIIKPLKPTRADYTTSTPRNLLFKDYDAKAKPMYVVDGKEVLDINNIEPNSIESVTVLKGDKGSKDYGDKGKNGVVIITTKTSIKAQ